MFLRAFLVIVSGFLFIFSPGLPMSLISRFSPDYKRDYVYWGIGIWILSLIPSLFIQSLLRQIFYQGQVVAGYTGQPLDFAAIFINALLSALFLGIGMLIVLKAKHKKDPKQDVVINGLAMGFGVGLVAQVFTGLNLVGAGFRLIFGDTDSAEILSAMAYNPLGLVIFSLVAIVLFRIALLSISAAQGFLTARAVKTRKGQFWVGVLINTIFTGVILAVQLLMGERIPGQVTVGVTPMSVSIVTILLYMLSFAASYTWLSRQLQSHKK